MINEKTIKFVKENISKGNDYVAYTSKIDGFGNEESDIDVYIFTTNQIADRISSKVTYSEEELDVEYVSLKYIQKILKLFKSKKKELDLFNLDWEDIKILHRISRSPYYELNNSLLKEIKSMKTEITLYISNFHFKESLAKYNDSLRFYKIKDYETAKFLAIESIQSSISSYLTIHGHIIVNKKWVITGIKKSDNKLLKDLLAIFFNKPISQIDYRKLLSTISDINKETQIVIERR